MSATSKREWCVVCDEVEPYDGHSPYCRPCGEVVAKERWQAIMAVRKAIKAGALWHPKLQRCVDCGKPAFDYDHRDYSEPLNVVPVCRRCNQLRGPAKRRPSDRRPQA